MSRRTPSSAESGTEVRLPRVVLEGIPLSEVRTHDKATGLVHLEHELVLLRTSADNTWSLQIFVSPSKLLAIPKGPST